MTHANNLSKNKTSEEKSHSFIDMPRYCAAYGCDNSSVKNSNVSFLSFPSDKGICHQWILATKRKNFNPGKYSYICSEHFLPTDFIEYSSVKKLYPNAVPTVFPSLPTYLQPPPKSRRTSIIEKRLCNYIRACSSSSPVDSMETSAENASDIRIAELEKKVDLLTKKLINSRKRHKLKNNRALRLKKKIKSLKDLTTLLRQQNIISDNDVINLRSKYTEEESKLMAQLLQGGNRPQVYSDEVREFSSSLFFHSPAAYSYLRRYLQLPGVSTIRSWLSNFGCHPGFTNESFAELESRISSCDIDDSERYRYCAVVVDGMSIHKDKQWDANLGRYVGAVDFGFDEVTSETASEAYVVMAVGLKGNWKVPLAYFMVNGLTATIIANIIKETLIRLHNISVIAVSVTFDGAANQIAAMELLGAKLTTGSSLRPHFPHPSDSSLIVVTILDVSHMIKLIRNALHAYTEFKWENHGIIKWAYFEKLCALQTDHQLRAGNKLTRTHIHFQNKKMRVYLATQLFSRSVADALRYCHYFSVPGFTDENVLVTADFCQLMNDIFDIMNSRSVFGKGFHAPIRTTNFESIQTFLKEAQESLHALSVNIKGSFHKLVSSKRKVGFIGFDSNCEVIRKLHEVLLLSSETPFTFILFYKFSQDALESFFGCIRSRNGWTTNPTASQFRSAYRSLLFHGSKMLKVSLNCNVASQDVANSLRVSAPVTQELQQSIKQGTEKKTKTDIGTLDCRCFLLDCSFCKATIAYISGFVAKSLMKKNICITCKDALLCSSEDDLLSLFELIAIKNRGGLLFPSKSLVQLVTLCESEFRKSVQKTNLGDKFLRHKIETELLQIAHLRNIFASLSQHDLDTFAGGTSHISLLCRLVIRKYLNIRFRKVGRDVSEELSASGKRTLLSRSIIFKNL